MKRRIRITRKPGESKVTVQTSGFARPTYRLVVSLPKGTRYVMPATRDYIACMESQRFETRDTISGADYIAEAVRRFLIHLRATVRVEEVLS